MLQMQKFSAMAAYINKKPRMTRNVDLYWTLTKWKQVTSALSEVPEQNLLVRGQGAKFLLSKNFFIFWRLVETAKFS